MTGVQTCALPILSTARRITQALESLSPGRQCLVFVQHYLTADPYNVALPPSAAESVWYFLWSRTDVTSWLHHRLLSGAVSCCWDSIICQTNRWVNVCNVCNVYNVCNICYFPITICSARVPVWVILLCLLMLSHCHTITLSHIMTVESSHSHKPSIGWR